MTKQDELKWLYTMLGSLAESNFYGDVNIQFQEGKITTARVSQTLKPYKPKAFNEMTLDEYRNYQERSSG